MDKNGMMKDLATPQRNGKIKERNQSFREPLYSAKSVSHEGLDLNFSRARMHTIMIWNSTEEVLPNSTVL